MPVVDFIDCVGEEGMPLPRLRLCMCKMYAYMPVHACTRKYVYMKNVYTSVLFVSKLLQPCKHDKRNSPNTLSG